LQLIDDLLLEGLLATVSDWRENRVSFAFDQSKCYRFCAFTHT
jgi:hypothetical protein